MIWLLNLYFNQRVAQHRKMFSWHLPQLKRKLMMMIMELQIKLLSNLVGRQGCVQLLSGNPVLKVMLLDNDEPMSYGEAMVGPDSNKWLEAMKSEIGSMYQNKVWTLVDLPDDRQAIEINGSLRRRRTWAVMLPSMKLDLWERVFSQVQGVDYDENFSPVAMLKSVGIMLALAVFFDYEIL